MHKCVGNLAIIATDKSLAPDRRQAIIGTNAGILLIRTLGTNVGELLIEIFPFSFNKNIRKCRLRNGGDFVTASIC